jgi:hypothetical protein
LVVGTAVVVIVAALVLGREAFITRPDLRTDGVHGILAAQVVGFSAQPVTATTVDGSRVPFDTLYLWGNADLYVLYNPCTDVVEFVSVGSTHITVIEEVSCPGPFFPESRRWTVVNADATVRKLAERCKPSIAAVVPQSRSVRAYRG